MDDSFRFGGVTRLLGAKKFNKLKAANICVIGIGGVGSWAAEALARSRVGSLTLVDYDDICESNINRQIHSTDGVIGMQKIDVMATRLHSISPKTEILRLHERFDSDTAEKILSSGYSAVIDATDQLKQKCILIHECREREIPLVVSGGSAGKQNPAMVEADDLAFTQGDRLLYKVRKKLRTDFGFPRDLKQKFGVRTVFSQELSFYPTESGEVTQDPQVRPHRPLDCSSGIGSASFVTGTFGFVAAYETIRSISVSN